MPKLKKTKGIKEDGTKILPSINVSETDLPSIKKRKIDDTFKLVLKVKVTELRRNRWDDKKKLQASLDILAISLPKQNYEEEYTDHFSK